MLVVNFVFCKYQVLIDLLDLRKEKGDTFQS